MPERTSSSEPEIETSRDFPLRACQRERSSKTSTLRVRSGIPAGPQALWEASGGVKPGEINFLADFN